MTYQIGAVALCQEQEWSGVRGAQITGELRYVVLDRRACMLVQVGEYRPAANSIQETLSASCIPKQFRSFMLIKGSS